VAAVLVFAKYARVGDRKRKRKRERWTDMAKTRGREREM